MKINCPAGGLADRLTVCAACTELTPSSKKELPRVGSRVMVAPDIVGDTLAGRAAVIDTIPVNALVAAANRGTSAAFTETLPEPSTLMCTAVGTITVPDVVLV